MVEREGKRGRGRGRGGKRRREGGKRMRENEGGNRVHAHKSCLQVILHPFLRTEFGHQGTV